MVQPVSGSGFYWIFVGFCGFLNIEFFTKPKPDFFWVAGFIGSTADPGRVSKHWFELLLDYIRWSLVFDTLFYLFNSPHNLPHINSTSIHFLYSKIVLFKKIQHPTPPFLSHIFLIYFHLVNTNTLFKIYLSKLNKSIWTNLY